jgi:hypothetical protein
MARATRRAQLAASASVPDRNARDGWMLGRQIQVARGHTAATDTESCAKRAQSKNPTSRAARESICASFSATGCVAFQGLRAPPWPR